jgi:hypothetical protein
MKGIIVEDSFVDQILGKKPKDSKEVVAKVSESTDKVEDETPAEEHSCPLCESKLSEPISESRLTEHVDFILGIINENFSEDGESLDEEVSEDSETSEDESK